MFLVVGLGNPGKSYNKTRHNVGFMVVDALAREHMPDATFKDKYHSQYTEGHIGSQKVVLLKPQTYMNLSGKAVLSALTYKKLEPQQVIVFQDDLDLALGKVKIKVNGGSAGHNGIKDIDERIGKDYLRVRIGICRPSEHNDISRHVLEAFSKDEQVVIDELIGKIVQHCSILFDKDYNLFMTKLSS